MKKISRLFCVMMLSLLLVVPFFNVDAAKKTSKKTTPTTTTAQSYAVSEDEKAVTMHVFYLPTCSHCQDLHEFLAELKEDKDYKDKFNVKDYNVQESLAAELLDKVRDYFHNNGGGVPYYVIGNQDYEGFGEQSKAEIKKTIDDLYGSKNYKDVVAAIDSGNMDSLKDDSSNIIGMVVLGLCVVIIIVLIVCSSKNKYYEEDEDEEEPEKESKETKEEENKENKATKAKSKSSKKTSNTKK